MGYGVIGSPTVSGSVSLGSSPGTPARKHHLLRSRPLHRTAPSSSGPGRRPLTAVARVRIPSGLRAREPPAHPAGGSRRSGPPDGVARIAWQTGRTAPSSSGPGRRPLTAVARVRIPSGLHRARAPGPSGRGLSPFRAEWPDDRRRAIASRRDPDESSPGRRPGDPLLRRRRPCPRDAVDTRDLPAGRHPLAAALRRAAGRVGGHRLAPADAHLPAAGRRVPARPVPARPADRDPGERLPGRRLREPVPVAGHRGRARRAADGAGQPGGRAAARASAAARSSASPTSTTASSPTSGAERARLVVDVWADRTAALGAHRRHRVRLPVREPRRGDRGDAVAPPRPDLRLPLPAAAGGEDPRRRCAGTGSAPAATCSPTSSPPSAPGPRVVTANEHWTAFVPAAARWPYEVQLFPTRKVPDMPALTDDERDAFVEVYLDVLARFARRFDTPMPYIASWNQAPVREGRDDWWLHLQLFSLLPRAREDEVPRRARSRAWARSSPTRTRRTSPSSCAAVVVE